MGGTTSQMNEQSIGTKLSATDTLGERIAITGAGQLVIGLVDRRVIILLWEGKRGRRGKFTRDFLWNNLPKLLFFHCTILLVNSNRSVRKLLPTEVTGDMSKWSERKVLICRNKLFFFEQIWRARAEMRKDAIGTEPAATGALGKRLFVTLLGESIVLLVDIIRVALVRDV